MPSVEAVRTLAKEYSIAILAATATPKTASELSEELDVPIATCYRRIEDLEAGGLLVEHDRVLGESQRRVSRYRRTVDGIAVDFADGGRVRAAERAAPDERRRRGLEA